MEKMITISFLVMFFFSSCTNKDKISNKDNNYTEIIKSIQIDSFRNIDVSWRSEVLRLLIYIKEDTLGYLLKRRSSEDKVIMLKYGDHWLLIDSIRDKESQIFGGVPISQIKYCYELMDKEKFSIRRISRDLKYGIKIISTDSIDYFYIPDTNIYGVDKYIETNNLKNVFGKWWIRNN